MYKIFHYPDLEYLFRDRYIMEDFIYLETIQYHKFNIIKDILFLKGIIWNKLPNKKMNGYYSYIDESTWNLIKKGFFESNIPKLKLLTYILNKKIIEYSLEDNGKEITEEVYNDLVDSINLGIFENE